MKTTQIVKNSKLALVDSYRNLLAAELNDLETRFDEIVDAINQELQDDLRNIPSYENLLSEKKKEKILFDMMRGREIIIPGKNEREDDDEPLYRIEVVEGKFVVQRQDRFRSHWSPVGIFTGSLTDAVNALAVYESHQYTGGIGYKAQVLLKVPVVRYYGNSISFDHKELKYSELFFGAGYNENDFVINAAGIREVLRTHITKAKLNAETEIEKWVLAIENEKY